MPTAESSLEVLANRVEKLETQNRRLKKVGIAIALLASAVVVMGQAPTSKVIEANEFRVKDANGRVRAKFFMSEGLGPRLDLFDEDENPMVSLFGIGRIGTLSLGSTSGSSRSVILEPNLGLLLTGDAGAISATTSKGLGGPVIRLSDNEGSRPSSEKLIWLKREPGAKKVRQPRQSSFSARRRRCFGRHRRPKWHGTRQRYASDQPHG